MQTRRDVFQAIADPTRREIINLVAYRSLNLNAIADNFDVSRPAISQHIKILAECGLIVVRKQGRERYCEARLQPLTAVSDWVEPFRKAWAVQFDSLDNLLDELKGEDTPDERKGGGKIELKDQKRGNKRTARKGAENKGTANKGAGKKK